MIKKDKVINKGIKAEKVGESNIKICPPCGETKIYPYDKLIGCSFCNKKMVNKKDLKESK